MDTKKVSLSMMLLLLLVVTLRGQTPVERLEKILTKTYSSDLKHAQYFLEQYDLNDDGVDEIILHAVDRWLCKWGGCTTMIFMRHANSLRLVAIVNATNPPIAVAKNKTNGWHDLIVTGAYYHGSVRFRFDGNTYPGNPKKTDNYDIEKVLIEEYNSALRVKKSTLKLKQK